MHPNRKRLPRHHGLAIPACITARAWRTCRDACQNRSLVVSFEVGGGENVPGIPGACATRNFTYLSRGSFRWNHFMRITQLIFNLSYPNARMYLTHVNELRISANENATLTLRMNCVQDTIVIIWLGQLKHANIARHISKCVQNMHRHDQCSENGIS